MNNSNEHENVNSLMERELLFFMGQYLQAECYYDAENKDYDLYDEEETAVFLLCLARYVSDKYELDRAFESFFEDPRYFDGLSEKIEAVVAMSDAVDNEYYYFTPAVLLEIFYAVFGNIKASGIKSEQSVLFYPKMFVSDVIERVRLVDMDNWFYPHCLDHLFMNYGYRSEYRYETGLYKYFKLENGGNHSRESGLFQAVCNEFAEKAEDVYHDFSEIERDDAFEMIIKLELGEKYHTNSKKRALIKRPLDEFFKRLGKKCRFFVSFTDSFTIYEVDGKRIEINHTHPWPQQFQCLPTYYTSLICLTGSWLIFMKFN